MVSSFEQRALINGHMLREFTGKNVSIMLKVDDEAGTRLNCTTTDGQKVRVSLPDPLDARSGDWCEIIGTPEGSDSIRGKEAILFSDQDFDTEAYNMLVLFMNNCKDIYRNGNYS